MKKKLLVAGYPRSGNTWLGYLLSFLLNAKYQELNAPKGFKSTHQKEILQFISGKLKRKSYFDSVVKTHERYSFSKNKIGLDKFDKVIYIVRDPRDVAVSLFFYKYYNSPIDQDRPGEILSRKPQIIGKYLWKKTVLQVAKEWPLHALSWRSFEGTHLVKYESLRKNPERTLKEIASFLEEKIGHKLIKNAIEQFSFKRLSGGRKSGEEHATGFFRKGIVGDHKNYFDRIDKFIFHLHAKQEMQELGYRLE